MAWYEMQGGGIPASLKNEMDSVLNKKWGTSTTYPADTWPDTVNLMGPLPEKTVSGSIVDFSDGADTVPLKKCEVSMPASLDGYSSINVKHTSINLLDFTVRDHFGITCEKTADGGAKMSGTATNTSYPVNWVPLTLPAGTYHILIDSVGTGMTIAYSKNGGYGGNLYTGDNVITLTAETEIGGYIRVSNGTVISDPETVYMQLSVEQNSYEPYTAPETYSASLGRTIYGGMADIVSGEGESLCGKITFDGSETRWNVYATGNGYAIPLTGMKRGTWYTSDLATCDIFPKVPDNNSLGVRIGVSNDGIYVVQANTIAGVTDLASFKTYLSNNPMTIIYPLDVTEAFAFDPVTINSKYGNNTIWSQEGSSEVTYRADISLALGQ